MDRSRISGVKAKEFSGDEGEELVRLQIMQAAERCFERNGVAKTTMDDVARAVRLSRPALYRYFSSRDDLIGAVLIRALRNFNARAHASIEPEATFGEAVITALTLAIKVAVNDRHVRLALSADVVGVAHEFVHGQAFQDVAAELWLPLLRRGIASGEARRNMDVSSAAQWLIDIEFLLATKVIEGLVEFEDVADMARQYVLPGLLSRAALLAGHDDF